VEQVRDRLDSRIPDGTQGPIGPRPVQPLRIPRHDVERDPVAQVADPRRRDEGDVLGVAFAVAGLDQLVLADATGDERRGALDPGGDDEAVIELQRRGGGRDGHVPLDAGWAVGW
jgi:hypothetical protein